MDDYQAYRLHRAIKYHFTQKSYDVFKNRGAIKGLTREYFESRKESAWFRGLAKKFNEPKDFVQFCVAQVVYGSIDDVFDIDKSQENYTEWIKNKQRSTYLIREEIEENNIDDLILGDPPKILRKTISKKLHLETAVAINRHRPFITDAHLKKHYLIFADEALKIRKLDRFVKYNEEAITTLLGPINKMSVGGGGLDQFNMESPSN